MAPATPSPPLPALISETLQQAESHRNGGRLGEALAAIDYVLSIIPNDAAALLQRFQTLLGLRRYDDAMACIWKALGNGYDLEMVGPDAAVALINLNRLAEARSVLDVVLQKTPDSGRAWGLLGETLAKQGKDVAAEACFRRNQRLAPNDPLVRIRLAQWLTQIARYDEAIDHLTEARHLAPDNLDAISGLAQTMISQGRLEEAEPLLHQVIAGNTEHLDARLGLARLLLLNGDLAAGWPAYEWRRRRSDVKMPKMTGAEWDGTPLCGKTIVIYAEQGFGDVIQFLRFIPLLAAEGARVILLIPRELERLCQCLATVAEVRSTLRPLPPYDFHIPLLSIGQFLGTTLDSIPADVPYLQVEPSDKHKLPVPLGTRLKVGLAWAGRPTHANNRHRSVSLETLLPLAAIPGVTLYSLQAGPRASDIHQDAHPALVGDLSPHLKDFVDTASVIEQLDLVITVDTSVAHLTGALGKPVWVLVPHAPDWRWLLGQEETRWYPTMRLFRQGSSARWDDVIAKLTAELGAMAMEKEEWGADGDCEVNAIFCRDDGQPRYRMPAPRSFLTDPGIHYLVERERKRIGYEFATRSFLDAHLQPGDLFIDVGAHWGIMSLQAATRWPGEISVLACEPTPRNLTHLRRWIAANGLCESIEVIPAAIADATGHGEMLPQSTMGHSLEKSDHGAIDVTTIDELLAARPHLADRRVIVKIDVEGSEGDVIAGMAGLLATGRVAAVIWERGRTHDDASVAHIRRPLAALGFTAWRFESEDKAGPLLPFADDGRVDNVFELSPALDRLPRYGEKRTNPVQPTDPILEATENASRFFQNGLSLQASGAIDKALSAYTQAATLDRRNPDLYNNLGVALQRLGRLPAAEAAYRRSLALAPDAPGCLCNLGSVLREEGKLDDSAAVYGRALTLTPNSALALVNAGHTLRDLGRPAEALDLFERALKNEPGHAEALRDRAEALLQQGDFEQGFTAYDACRQTPARTSLPRWDGAPLDGKTIVVQDDASIEDALQFFRFVPELAARGADKIVVTCRPELMRLFAQPPGVDTVLRWDEDDPTGDFTVSMLSLPCLLQDTLSDVMAGAPYLRAAPLSLPLPREVRPKVGLVWATASSRRGFSCPLALILPILSDPGIALFSLQEGPQASELATLGADTLIHDLGPRLIDGAETAAILADLDLLVTVDSPLAHLAGALGVLTLVLLPSAAGWRWMDNRQDSPWYPSLRLLRQQTPNQWETVLRDLAAELAAWKHGRSLVKAETSTCPIPTKRTSSVHLRATKRSRKRGSIGKSPKPRS